MHLQNKSKCKSAHNIFGLHKFKILYISIETLNLIRKKTILFLCYLQIFTSQYFIHFILYFSLSILKFPMKPIKYNSMQYSLTLFLKKSQKQICKPSSQINSPPPGKKKFSWFVTEWVIHVPFWNVIFIFIILSGHHWFKIILLGEQASPVDFIIRAASYSITIRASVILHCVLASRSSLMSFYSRIRLT